MIQPEVIDTTRELETNDSATAPVEAIKLPNGTIEPAHPMVLEGLKFSVQAQKMPLDEAMQRYQTWDPNYPVHPGHFK